MHDEPTFTEVELPELCDECAVALRDALQALLDRVELRYQHRIQSFYDDYAAHNINVGEPANNGIHIDGDDIPF